MKASELRIGNWVSEDSEDEYYELQIKDWQWIKDHDAFEPIPLTEEWLKRFDWDRESMEEGLICYELVYDDIINQYHFYIYSIGGNKINCATIQHVHQLQNLYHALTGEELEIKNK